MSTYEWLSLLLAAVGAVYIIRRFHLSKTRARREELRVWDELLSSIRITNPEPESLEFITLVENSSEMYLEPYIRAEINWEGAAIRLPDEHRYSGVHTLRILPKPIRGHLDLANHVQGFSEDHPPSQARVRIWMALPDKSHSTGLARYDRDWKFLCNYYWKTYATGDRRDITSNAGNMVMFSTAAVTEEFGTVPTRPDARGCWVLEAHRPDLIE